MAIKQLNRDPRVSDLTTEDIIINSKNGSAFYKTENNVINKIPGSNEVPTNNSVFTTTSFQLVYFASDLYQHAGMINMLGIFKNHNKKNYEIMKETVQEGINEIYNMYDKPELGDEGKLSTFSKKNRNTKFKTALGLSFCLFS